MKRVITLTGLAMAIGLASMGAQAAGYVAGKDYRVLDNPETISGDAIIVREFFWYGGHQSQSNNYISLRKASANISDFKEVSDSL